jgi:hypothetical protein
MAMQITPGYDFTANEVPTVSKLTTMVAGMSITGIDMSQVAATLLGEVLGDTGASMPLVGWLRSDALGALWVRTNNGQVRVYRANWGGWESNRFRAGAGDNNVVGWDADTKINTIRGRILNFPSNDTNESNLYIWPTGGATAHISSLKALDSAASGSPMRLVGRGGCPVIVKQADRSSYGMPAYLEYATFASNYGIESLPVDPGTTPHLGFALRQLSSGRSLAWIWGATLSHH